MATYFVNSATTGADAGDDTRLPATAQNQATPWRTLAKITSIFSTLANGDTVSFKRGETFYGTLISNKSGISGLPIHFNAYGSGAKPIFTGFGTVTAWAALGASRWVSTAILNDLVTSATIPVRPNMVLVGGNFQAIGRWPTFGFQLGGAPAVGTNKIDSFTGGDNVAGTTATITSAGLASGSLVAPPTTNWGLVAGPPIISAGELVIRKRHWIIDKMPVVSQSGTTITYTNPTVYGANQPNFGFFIQNHQLACDTQGEWWWDNQSGGRLGMFSAVTPAGVQVSTIDNVLNLGNNSWFTFNDIEIRGANAAAVNLTGGTNHVFTNCDFNFCGFDAFHMSFNSAANVTLSGCTSTRVNNNFVTAATSSGWNINNCTFTDIGQVAGMGFNDSSTYNGLSNMGANCTITNNRFTNVGYIAIDFRGNGSLIQNNVIDTFCNVKDDGSGIYTFTCLPTVAYTTRTVNLNLILNGGGNPAAGDGVSRGTNTTNRDAHGIYLDDNASQVTVTNNTVANCGGSGIFFHQNHNITVQNNTFYNNAITGPGNYGQCLYANTVCGADPVRNFVVTGNKFISRTASQIVASIQTGETDMTLWPVSPATTNWNNNYYCRPISETATTFHIVRSSGTTNTDIVGWRTASSATSGSRLDQNSHISPATTTNLANIQFFYNDTSSNTTAALGSSTYWDMTGAVFTGNVLMAPQTSLVLILITAGPPTAHPRSHGYVIV